MSSPPALSANTAEEEPFSTVIDAAAVAVEIGLHQRRLLLRMLRPARPGPAVHVGLNHQRLLALLLLLLFQQCSLERGTQKSICYWTPNSSNPPWRTVVSFTPSPALQQLANERLGCWVTGNLSKKPQPTHCWNTFCWKQQIIKMHLSERPTSCQSLLGNNPWENNSVRILTVKQWEGKQGHEAEMPISVSVN